MLLRIAAAGLVLGGIALHVVPCARAGTGPPCSSAPTIIRVVCSNSGKPDSIGGNFSVIYRDIACNPTGGVLIRVDFSACPDIRIASNQLNVNAIVDCSSRSVSVLTNPAGIASFTVLGSSWAAGTYAAANCATIYAELSPSQKLGSATVAALDLNGFAGVSASDLALWLGDLGRAVYRGRSDYDGNGTISAADLAIWLGALGRGYGSSVSAAVCP